MELTAGSLGRAVLLFEAAVQVAPTSTDAWELLGLWCAALLPSHRMHFAFFAMP